LPYRTAIAPESGNAELGTAFIYLACVAPLDEYTRRLNRREAQVRRYERIHERLGYVRLLVVVVGLAIAWFSLRSDALSPWWIAAPVLAFIAIAIYHARVLQAKQRAERAAEVYRGGIARIEDRWATSRKGSEPGERFADPHHVYSADLDLFGRDSLFELLSTARTRMGEDTLAQWLLAPADVPAIVNRHEAGRDLAGRLDFREDLAVISAVPSKDGSPTGVHPDLLIEWAEFPESMPGGMVRYLAPLLSLTAIAGAVAWAVWDRPWFFAVILLVNGAFILSLRRRMEVLLARTDRAFDDIELLEQVVERIEREEFASEQLRALTSHLQSHHTLASRAMKRFGLIADMVRSRESIFIRTLDWPLLYSVNMAYIAEAWRKRHGQAVRGWLTAVGELEALVSLATYHYEHPADAFPGFTTGPAMFEAQGLGHPLIAQAKCVRNDVAIAGETRVLLVSGSNMSGKSTLLRSVGINVVMAMAGAPVRAAAMLLTPLRVGASIRINDSLHEGSSRFYAEVKRLRDILDLAGRDPKLLFLLDEFLQGTNSHDRRIGAEGALRALMEKGSIGLISTHDLALTAVSGENHWVHNVHFQDDLVGNEMRFDYKLRQGVVTKSNGLELMRALGIKV
jgi:uncharacterized membrane protein